MKNRFNRISQEDFELIDHYLRDKMDPDEIDAFESRLGKDPLLKEITEEYSLLFNSVGESVLQKEMERYHSDLPTPQEATPERPAPRVRYLVAAVIALLILIGGYWLMQPAVQDPFDEFFSPDPGLPTTMGTTDEYPFYEGMVYYKQGKYDSAIVCWSRVLSKDPSSDTVNYFLGVAHLANHDAPGSRQFLKAAAQHQGSFFQDDAFYYLGLSYLKTHNTAEARKYLEYSNLEKSKPILEMLNE